jgi:hypothetical protein
MIVEEVLALLPLKKRPPSGWLDVNFEHIAGSVDERNEAARIYASTKTSEAKTVLQRARRDLKRRKKVAKNKCVLQVLQAGDGSPLPGGKDRKDMHAMWKLATKLKKGAKKWKPWLRINIVDANGILASDPEGNAEIFGACYDTLFTNDVHPDGPAKARHAQMQERDNERNWLAPTMKELRAAVAEMKSTAPGLSGITSAVWKAMIGDPEMEQVLLDIMVTCWSEKEVPEKWTKFYMRTLEKKGDLTLPSNYRGISTSETLSKVHATMLKVRLQSLHEDLAPEHSGSFRRGRGRVDCICTAKSTLRQRKKLGLGSCVVACDCKKMFDKIPRKHIWSSMRKMGVHEGMIQAVMSTLLNVECVLHVGGGDQSGENAARQRTRHIVGPRSVLAFHAADLKFVARQNPKGTHYDICGHCGRNSGGENVA